MRHIYFIAVIFIAFLLFQNSFRELIDLAFHDSLYSHFMLIPIVSLYIIVKTRKQVFEKSVYAVSIGLPVVAIGLLLYGIGYKNAVNLNQNDYLFLMMLSFWICFIGIFIGIYGIRAFRQAQFPLMFLIFAIPVPTVILDHIIKLLLIGSAETAYKVFQILGVPIYRQDFVFELPGVSVEVARQCSGIRSTLAIVITSVLAGYLFLDTGWRRAVLCICVIPVTVFKNSLRIVTISLLAAFVDPIFLTNHWIHSAGGKPFFVLALLFMVPILWGLRRSEKKQEEKSKANYSVRNIV